MVFPEKDLGSRIPRSWDEKKKKKKNTKPESEKRKRKKKKEKRLEELRKEIK